MPDIVSSDGLKTTGNADDRVSANLRSLKSPSTAPWSRERATESGVYSFNSLDPRSRSFNLIRGQLLEAYRDRGLRAFGVVSATPDVGKSFVCANIAASLSRDPKLHTYGVDLDLRRGSLTARFGLPVDYGLSDHLKSGSPLLAFQLEGEELTIVPTRGGMVHSAELLATERARALFQAMHASDANSIFLCDLPPVFANDDAVATMSHLDSYILVAEEGKTTTREIRDSVEVLGRERLVGVVLNKFRGGLVSEGYGVENYYAYGYGAE